MKIIINQKEGSRQRGTFGPWGSEAANGCGAIALYHLLCILGEPVSYEEIRIRMNRFWWKSTIAGGRLGTNPLYLFRYLKKAKRFRLTCYFLFGKRRKQAEKIPCTHQGFLNLYFYRWGAHYTASRYQDGRLRIYNDNCAPADYAQYSREVKAFAMFVIGVDRAGAKEVSSSAL